MLKFVFVSFFLWRLWLLIIEKLGKFFIVSGTDFLGSLPFFPTSFYFAGVYTESLFLCLVLGYFYSLKEKKWLLAGILSALARYLLVVFPVFMVIGEKTNSFKIIYLIGGFVLLTLATAYFLNGYFIA